MSSTGILYVITSHQRLWSLLLTFVPNTVMNIILDFNEHRSLNINKKVILED